MPRRSSIPPEDPNQAAFRIVGAATDETRQNGKNVHAVALGRLGGLKGGKARAEKLSARKRQEIARRAARARWAKRRPT